MVDKRINEMIMFVDNKWYFSFWQDRKLYKLSRYGISQKDTTQSWKTLVSEFMHASEAGIEFFEQQSKQSIVLSRGGYNRTDFYLN